MRKHKVTLIETPNLNDVKEGDIYIKMDANTGLIKEMAKRRNGKIVSMLYYKSKEESNIQALEITESINSDIKEVPASLDTLDVKPLKIE